LLADAPAMTETLLELLSVKSKLLVLENHAFVSGLGFALFLKAFALSHPSVETVTGPEYFVDDCVGDVPSIV
jgi:hypothetical protein